MIIQLLCVTYYKLIAKAAYGTFSFGCPRYRPIISSSLDLSTTPGTPIIDCKFTSPLRTAVPATRSVTANAKPLCLCRVEGELITLPVICFDSGLAEKGKIQWWWQLLNPPETETGFPSTSLERRMSNIHMFTLFAQDLRHPVS